MLESTKMHKFSIVQNWTWAKKHERAAKTAFYIFTFNQLNTMYICVKNEIAGISVRTK